MHPSTLREREAYYRDEFDIDKVRSWFKTSKRSFPQLLAVDMGTETGIIKDPAKKNKLINIRPASIRQKLLKYLPEDVYYDRNIYKDPEKLMKTLGFRDVWESDNHLGQELAFDIDPENIKCNCSRYCDKCIVRTVDEALGLAEYLETKFSRVSLVYSGRGMHVHVHDKEAFSLSIKEREAINEEVKGFPIDPWVSRGYIRLMRLPFSLNALVSRIVTPLTINEAADFNPLTSKKIIPRFL